jgi:4-hydroxythreonine-4-phosphate dehydrogenase
VPQDKPHILFTLGDPAGIGPEVAVKALCDASVRDRSRITVVGDPELLDRAMTLCGCSVDVETVFSRTAGKSPSAADRGKYLFESLKLAVQMCLDGKAEAVVTAPISKAALHAGGFCYPGHTEILGELTGAKPVMMLVGGQLRVVPMTTHCALSEVPALLTRQLVYDTALAVHRSLVRDFALAAPKIAVTGLNPHAGEGGLFGNEEQQIINPAVQSLKEQGIDVTGALPADTAFYFANQGKFDAVIAPTHDQALIPLKLVAFAEGVNVTLNLPIVRTSPGHGTAEDIAWKNQADPTSMIHAARTAIRIAQNRKGA